MNALPRDCQLGGPGGDEHPQVSNGDDGEGGKVEEQEHEDGVFPATGLVGRDVEREADP